jgi:PAT family beta-lactamase induction signal transducer AmpG
MLGHYITNRRIQTVLLLGFSSGLPLALTGSSLQAWFTQSGVDLVTIGSLTLLGLPYVWKFLWAPLLDRFIPPLLGRRRGWILLTQLGLCVAIIIMARLNPATQPSIIGLVALVIAFISATQDIATDAYRTDILHPEERGLGAAAVTLGFRIAMLVSGGLALVMADYVGWQVTFEIMAGLIGLSIIATLCAPKETPCIQPTQSLATFIVEPFKDLLSRDKIALTLLFVMIYKLGDALALALMSNFLLGELGFTLTDVGIAFKTFGLIATLMGAFVGGILMVRISLYQALIGFGLLQAFSNVMFVLLAMMGKHYLLMVSCIFIESFCSGMSTAAFVAFLMSLCNVKFSATQYAFLSALFALGRVFSGPIAAVMVHHIGWVNFYWAAFLLSFPGIILLTYLRGCVRSNNEEAIA